MSCSVDTDMALLKPEETPMRHPHVRVYANDHADSADLIHDYPCRDIAEARQRMRDLMREFVDSVGANAPMGVDVEYEEDRVVTMRPQDEALAPLHLTIHFCEQPHDAG